jgi:hypothetical protein
MTPARSGAGVVDYQADMDIAVNPPRGTVKLTFKPSLLNGFRFLMAALLRGSVILVMEDTALVIAVKRDEPND